MRILSPSTSPLFAALLVAFVAGCAEDKGASGSAPSASASAVAAPPSAATSVAVVPPPPPPPPPAPTHACPPDTAGDGTLAKPCEAKGTARMMEVTWTNKMDDAGPQFRVVNKGKETILYGKAIAYFYDKPMKDSNYDKGGNGTISAEQVFEKSSNIGTAMLVRDSYVKNPQKFLDKLHSFGIQNPLGIDLAGETPPLLYKSVKDKGWSGLSLTQLAIGYETQCTPLQTLSFYNAVANNGKMVRPQFVQEIRRNGKVIEESEPIVVVKNFCKGETIKACKKMMEGVMEKGGTADYVFASSPYKVAGKTGTAWLNEGGKYQSDRYRASFVGYFPAEDPKYSCIVVVNDPRSGVYYGSAVAAPVFKELADKIYSTEMDFREPVAIPDSLVLAQHRIPISKSGSSQDLKTVFNGLKIPMEVLFIIQANLPKNPFSN